MTLNLGKMLPLHQMFFLVKVLKLVMEQKLMLFVILKVQLFLLSRQLDLLRDCDRGRKLVMV